jgi:hypothetical protein
MYEVDKFYRVFLFILFFLTNTFCLFIIQYSTCISFDSHLTMSKYRMSACQLLTDFLSLFVNLKYFTIMIGKEKDEFFKYGICNILFTLGGTYGNKNLDTQVCIL